MSCRKNHLPRLALAAAAALAACDDSSTFIPAGGTPPQAGGALQPEAEGPAYIVSTRVFDPEVDARTSYFYVVDSLDAGTEIDETKGLELPGSARLFADEETGWIAIGSGEDATITRYTVSADGRLLAGDRMSLQSYGVTSHWSDDLYFVSPTKLYYPDRSNQQLLILNPEEMAITGTIPLPAAAAREGYEPNYSYEAVYRGELLLFTIGWFDWTNDAILGETGLVVIDTSTDQVLRVDVNDSCGGITTPVNLDSGDTYLLASALAAANHRLERLPTPPCALRIRAGEDTFDPGYAQPLSALVDGALAGEPVHAGGDSLYFRVFDESAASVQDGQFSWDITGQPVWSWVRWDVSEPAAQPDPTLVPSTADVVWFRADERTFGMEALDEEYSRTRLIELSAAGGAAPRLTAPGFLQGLARAR